MRNIPLLICLSFIILPSLAYSQEKDLFIYGLQVEQAEYSFGDENERLFNFDADAFAGNDDFKLRWLSSGEYDIRANSFERLENRFVLQRPVSDFFDVKAGFRIDTPAGKDRWYGVVGLAGLAPQWIEMDVDLFVSETGDISTRFDAEYDLLITNRLALTASLELDAAFSNDPAIGIGKGVNKLETGLRLGYDLLDRMVSPYAGVVLEESFGKTRDFAEDEGEDTGGWRFVVGTRLVY